MIAALTTEASDDCVGAGPVSTYRKTQLSTPVHTTTQHNTTPTTHRKYYDLAAYEASKAREEREKAAAKAATRQGTRKATEQADEQEFHNRRVEERKKEQEKRVREAMDALRWVYCRSAGFVAGRLGVDL